MKTLLTLYGGKQNLADWVISNFPADIASREYVEPCFGGGAVFFAKPPVKHELISDLDDRLYAFYRACQDQPDELLRRLKSLRVFEQEFKRASRVMRGKEEAKDNLDKAVCLWITVSWSFNKSVGSQSLRVRADRGLPVNVEMETKLSHYPRLLKRIKYATILNRDMFRVIDQFDRDTSFFYIDPPYPNTHQKYGHKFGQEDFNKLVERLKAIKGLFMLSFYKMDWMGFPPEWTLKSKRSRCSINAWQKSYAEGERREYIAMNYKPHNEQLSGLG